MLSIAVLGVLSLVMRGEFQGVGQCFQGLMFVKEPGGVADGSTSPRLHVLCLVCKISNNHMR